MISCNSDSYDGWSICLLACVKKEVAEVMAQFTLMVIPVSLPTVREAVVNLDRPSLPRAVFSGLVI